MLEVDEKALQRLFIAVRKVYGYDFTEYAEASLKRRVLQYMDRNQYVSIEELQASLLGNELLFEQFIRDLSVTVTEMFRDPVFYRSLRDKVITRLATYPFIKVWIAGCATGEEAYSVAILLKEAGLLSRSVIYATDINQKSLQLAATGVFPLASMKGYTSNYQKSGGTEDFSRYYTAKYDSVLFDKELRQNMVFAAHNLAVDQSFNEFQLILCRNVLIYFNQSLQNKAINLFYDSLCPFGVLGLGNKESLLFSDKRSGFEELDRKEKIYIKING